MRSYGSWMGQSVLFKYTSRMGKEAKHTTEQSYASIRICSALTNQHLNHRYEASLTRSPLPRPKHQPFPRNPLNQHLRALSRPARPNRLRIGFTRAQKHVEIRAVALPRDASSVARQHAQRDVAAAIRPILRLQSKRREEASDGSIEVEH